ncbi:FAD-dependent oxidoreductase [Halomarina litorea]|uniref:FAD-dependent oxidoreductase n=1 Tax=Halomarina litorea TaxID=2961595 RepID=UPI0020C4F371|nr:FAD-dependent oxidoreductase [Halomarina sp. BCD28]
MDQTDAAVAGVTEVGPNAVALDVETPDGFEAHPGQFVRLSLEIEGERESRFYTISSPDVGDTFEVTLTYDPNADEEALGPRLAGLSPGDSVGVAGPFGDAYYEGESNTLVLAGGPGVGPAVGIAERTLADGGEAAVVYLDDNPIHEDRLSTLAEEGATVHLVDDPANFADAVTDAADDGAQAFVYGFAGFLEDALDALADSGVDPETVKTESFGPAPE